MTNDSSGELLVTTVIKSHFLFLMATFLVGGILMAGVGAIHPDWVVVSAGAFCAVSAVLMTIFVVFRRPELLGTETRYTTIVTSSNSANTTQDRP